MVAKPEKNTWAVRMAIGSLFKAVTLSTDPAMTLGYEASLINASRAALIQKFEDRVPDSAAVPSLIKTIITITLTNWKEDALDEEGYNLIDERVGKIFKDSSMARYGLEIYRDLMFLDELHKRWLEANKDYIVSHESWVQSNAVLAAANMQLMEIIVRHDLMTFPKGEVFNMDAHGSNMGQMMKQIGEEKEE